MQEPNLDFQLVLIENIEDNDEDRVPSEGQDCHEDESNEEVPTGKPDHEKENEGDLNYEDEILVQENEVSTENIANEDTDSILKQPMNPKPKEL